MNKPEYKDLFYRQANSTEYLIAAEILYLEYNSLPTEPDLSVKFFITNPIIVLYALSIELILKAILLAEQADQRLQYEHNLSKLFNNIQNDSYKSFVKDAFEEKDFLLQIERFSDAFTRVRYLWEELPSKGSFTMTNTKDIEFMRKLAHRIVHGFPIITKEQYSNL